MNTDGNIFTDPAERARMSSQPLSVVKQPAPAPVVVTRFAGIDGEELQDQSGAGDALSRRIEQVRAIASLMGATVENEDCMSELPRHTHAYAAWAVRDLLDEADAILSMLHKLPPKVEVE